MTKKFPFVFLALMMNFVKRTQTVESPQGCETLPAKNDRRAGFIIKKPRTWGYYQVTDNCPSMSAAPFNSQLG